MRIKPLNDRVLLVRGDAEQKTAGGIIIPDTAKEKPAEGKVVACGPGKRDEAGKRRPLDVKAGDRVLFQTMPAPTSRSMASTTSSCGKRIFWR